MLLQKVKNQIVKAILDGGDLLGVELPCGLVMDAEVEVDEIETNFDAGTDCTPPSCEYMERHEVKFVNLYAQDAELIYEFSSDEIYELETNLNK